MKKDSPIGFFDSGVGGLSVYARFRELLPSENTIYFGDLKNLPYGGKSQDELVGLATDILDFFKEKNVITIYNGVDTEFFVPTSSDLRKKYGLENKFVILGAANKWLNPINKDTFDFVTANLPEDCVLFIIGCNEEQKRVLTQNVFTLGYISDRDELRKMYSMADVFANCTREESLSLINVEAQACGTPVVTYKNTGAQETVDNRCSFSVENGSDEEFFNAIMNVKKLSKNSLSSGCHIWAKDKFNRYENYRKYIDLYKS